MVNIVDTSISATQDVQFVFRCVVLGVFKPRSLFTEYNPLTTGGKMTSSLSAVLQTNTLTVRTSGEVSGVMR